jgi:CheY-like chemotaxis protein
VVLLSKNGHAGVHVRDSGLGIDPKFLPMIFDRFRQVDNSTTRRHGGLGLGLAIVKHIVQLHGGCVTADSAGMGMGATFSIVLPLAPAESAIDAPAATVASNPLAGTAIIVLDDDADASELLRRILSEHGAVVATATSAKEALQLVEKQPRLLLSDIGLPDMDGYQLIRSIRAHPNPTVRGIPAIAVTAFARQQDHDQALQAGFHAHVPKPVDESDLINAIVQVLRSRMGQTAPAPTPAPADRPALMP